jgi:hypothetical protein
MTRRVDKSQSSPEPPQAWLWPQTVEELRQIVLTERLVQE